MVGQMRWDGEGRILPGITADKGGCLSLIRKRARGRARPGGRLTYRFPGADRGRGGPRESPRIVSSGPSGANRAVVVSRPRSVKVTKRGGGPRPLTPKRPPDPKRWEERWIVRSSGLSSCKSSLLQEGPCFFQGGALFDVCGCGLGNQPRVKRLGLGPIAR
jgi:hypothetical protein